MIGKGQDHCNRIFFIANKVFEYVLCSHVDAQKIGKYKIWSLLSRNLDYFGKY